LAVNPNQIDRGRAPTRDLLLVAALLLALLFVAMLAVDASRRNLAVHEVPLRALIP
jgi:hypothetical protein